jgi:hypothetical protein
MRVAASIFLLAMFFLTQSTAECFANQQAAKRSIVRVSEQFWKDLNQAADPESQEKKTYLQMLQERTTCHDDDVKCQTEIYNIMISWMMNPVIERVKGFDQHFMFRHLYFALHAKNGKMEPNNFLAFYYELGWGGLPVDQEVSVCWSSLYNPNYPRTEDDCEELELKKFGIKNPWLYLKEDFPKLDYPKGFEIFQSK